MGGSIGSFSPISDWFVDAFHGLTLWDIVVAFNGNVLGQLNVINTFEDFQSVASTDDAHFFQLIVLESRQRSPVDTMF